MLVLTRKREDKIKIGDNIIVTVLEVDGGNVKIGIDAPRDIQILRMEVVEQIKQENVESASKTLTDIKAAADLIRQKQGTRIIKGLKQGVQET